MFVALLATGVLMVLIYVWSGESLVALILSIITLFAVLALAQAKPWSAAGGLAMAGPAGRRAELLGGAPGSDDEEPIADLPVWRGRFDVTYDERGVSGVAVGDSAPRLYSWSQIDDISQAWVTASTGEQLENDLVLIGETEERVGLRLDFPSLRNPEEPENASLMFGPKQHPDIVMQRVRQAWRDSKRMQSRLYDLTLEERTSRLVDHFGHGTIDLRGPTGSAELLYQEIRRALLASGELCRLDPDSSFDEVLDSFDGLLEANDVDVLSQDEADELAAADGPDRLASLHWTLDWIAEQRGYRLAFIDQGGEDYLLGLVPAGSADDWDGQTIGSGSARVVLDLPS